MALEHSAISTIGAEIDELIDLWESVVDGKKYNFLITSQEYANEVKKNLEKEDYYVKSVGEKEKNRTPGCPNTGYRLWLRAKPECT